MNQIEKVVSNLPEAEFDYKSKIDAMMSYLGLKSYTANNALHFTKKDHRRKFMEFTYDGQRIMYLGWNGDQGDKHLDLIEMEIVERRNEVFKTIYAGLRKSVFSKAEKELFNFLIESFVETKLGFVP